MENFSDIAQKMQTEAPTASIDLSPVEFGQEIVIAASRSNEDIYSVIDLCTKDPNIALHMSIRKDEIVRNHREGKNFDYNKEERDENLFDAKNKQPIKKDQPFLMSIFMSDEKFHIAIDEKAFCTFKYRLPIKEITKVVLTNLVHITQVDQRSLHPKKWPPIPYNSPDTVFSHDVPRLFKPLNKTIITGKVVSTEGSFDIHFQSRNTNRELLLMRITVGKNTIELKAMDEKGKYVNEETKTYPFMTNQIFRIGISCVESQFGIAVDGQELCTYKYVDKDLLDKMTGFKIRTSKGFKLDLCAVESGTIDKGVSNLAASTEPPVTRSVTNEMVNDTFVAGLACPMSFSNSIIIEGIASDKSKSPMVGLKKKDLKTVVLGLRVDYAGKMIGRNTQIDGKWGKEESTENLFDPKSPNPIVPGKEFKICFTAGFEKFFISINDRPFCTYKHRLPLEEITKVWIKSMNKITRLDQHTPLPSPWPLKQAFMTGKDFANDIAVKFKTGHCTVIGGNTQGKGWFTIDFYDKVFERNLMHFNVRFDENVVARAWKNRKCEFQDWDNSGGFPFRLNGRFKIAIAFAKDQFLFAVNGTKFCSYKYHEEIFEASTGLKLNVDKGLTIQINEVDHLILDPDCNGYDGHSKLPPSPDDRVCPRIGKVV